MKCSMNYIEKNPHSIKNGYQSDKNSLKIKLKILPFLIFIVISCLLSNCKKDTFQPLPPSIMAQPEAALVTEGEIAKFSVLAEGTEPFIYQWYRDGGIIVGATGRLYTTPVTDITDNGSAFSVKITNEAGTLQSNQAVLTVQKDLNIVIIFTSQGSSFSPVIEVEGVATVQWTWSDGGTSSSLTPTKNYGSEAERYNILSVTPWSALKSINIGNDQENGIIKVADQKVSSVLGLHNVAPHLEIWCSAYNSIASLNFSNFEKLHTIDCFSSKSLQEVNLTNTPSLKNICFELCALNSLDVSQNEKLEFLKAADNDFTEILLGSTGENIWHLCIRDNPQLTDQQIFENMAQFPNISDLYGWNSNQSGILNISSTSSIREVNLFCQNNYFTNVNLTGSLLQIRNPGKVWFYDNELEQIDITGCIQINELLLQNNKFDQADVDLILEKLDELGRDRDNTSLLMDLHVNLSGNAAPSQTGYDHALNLSGKGWRIITDNWTMEPQVPGNSGESVTSFTTNGDHTSMRCDYAGSAIAHWYWSDGTFAPAVSGKNIEKAGLGSGNHNHTLVISNGSSLFRFGTPDGGGLGHLVSISNFTNSPYLSTIYLFQESMFTSLGSTDLTKVREYHLKSTGLSTASMDKIFADAVASNVYNGIFYCNNLGTSASDANKLILHNRGWLVGI